MRYRRFDRGLRYLASACVALGLVSVTSRVAESQSEMVKLDAYTGAFQVGGQYTTISWARLGKPANR